jgi:hypothetical protein
LGGGRRDKEEDGWRGQGWVEEDEWRGQGWVEG